MGTGHSEEGELYAASGDDVLASLRGTKSCTATAGRRASSNDLPNQAVVPRPPSTLQRRSSTGSFGSFGSLQQIPVATSLRRAKSAYDVVHVIEPATPMRRGSTDDLVGFAGRQEADHDRWGSLLGFDFDTLDALEESEMERQRSGSTEADADTLPPPPAALQPARARSYRGGNALFDFDGLDDPAEDPADADDSDDTPPEAAGTRAAAPKPDAAAEAETAEARGTGAGEAAAFEAAATEAKASDGCQARGSDGDDVLFDFDGLDEKCRRPSALSMRSHSGSLGSPKRRRPSGSPADVLPRRRSRELAARPRLGSSRCLRHRSNSAPPTPRPPGLRIGIIANGSRGDLQPIVALSLRLQRCRHHVRIFTNSDLVGFCQSRGVDAVSVFAACQDVIETIGGMSGGFGHYNGKDCCLSRGRIAAEQWILDNPDACHAVDDALDEFMPQAVICGTQASGPALRAELSMGIPAVPIYLSLDAAEFGVSLISMQPSRPAYLAMSPAFVRADEEQLIAGLEQTGDWVFEDSPTDADLAEGGKLYELQRFFDSGPKPVAIGWSSMICEGVPQHEMLALALRTLSRIKRRGVVIGGWARLDELWAKLARGEFDAILDDARELRAFAEKNVCFVADAPHAWLAPQCSCVVHHGGAGTTHAVLRSGVPQVITPIFGDQFGNAALMRKHGVGFGFPKGLQKVSVHELAEAISVAEGTVATAAELGKKMQQENGVIQAAQKMDAFLRQEVQSGKWAAKFDKVRGHQGRSPANADRERTPRSRR